VVALYRRLRPQATPEDVFYAAVTDSRSWRGAVLEAEARVTCEAPTFVYQINFGSPLEGGALKACHMIDIPLIFGTTSVPGALSGDGDEARALSGRMRDMLGRFVRTGNPNGPRLPGWTPYDLARRSTLILDVAPTLVDDPRSAERRFFSAFPFIQRGTI
jgi:para-nitrobenzyl esterase